MAWSLLWWNLHGKCRAAPVIKRGYSAAGIYGLLAFVLKPLLISEITTVEQGGRCRQPMLSLWSSLTDTNVFGGKQHLVWKVVSRVLLHSLVPFPFIFTIPPPSPGFFLGWGWEFFKDFFREKLPVNDNNVLACKLFLHTYAMWRRRGFFYIT